MSGKPSDCLVVEMRSLSTKGDIYAPDVNTSQVDERKLMRKIDLRLIPWLTVLYLLNFLDRGTIGNAKVGALKSTSEFGA